MAEAANCGTDQFAIALTNTAPSASNTALADITQIAYTGFGSRNLTTTSSSQTGGVYSLVWASLTLGTTVTSATFRYVVIYDDTLAGDPLVGWYDLGVGTTIPANTSLILSGMGLDLDGSFDPASLFGVNDRGVVFDLSSTSLLFQNSGGTGAVAYGDPVGYADDIGPLAKNATQATAGNRPLYSGVPRTLGSDFAPAPNTWTLGTGWTESGGVFTKTAGTASVASVAVTLTAGKHYQIFLNMTRTGGTVLAKFTGGTTVAGISRNTAGSYIDVLVSATGNTTLELSADASFAGTVKNVVIKEVLTFTNAGALFDQVDDFLQTAAVDASNSDKMTIVASLRNGQSVSTATIVAHGNYPGSVSGSSDIVLNSAWQARLRGDTGSATISVPAVEAPKIYNPQANVLVAEFDIAGATIADEIYLESRGASLTQTTGGTTAGGGNFANNQVTIGKGLTGSQRCGGLINRIFTINRTLASGELASVRDWAKQGMAYCAVLGDSTVALINSSVSLPVAMRVSSLVGGCISAGADLSDSGDRIADQKTLWTALADKSALQAVFVQIGLNDVKGRVGANTATTAQVIADLQDLIDTINTDKPAGCKTYICGLTPCKVWLDAATNPTAANAAWADVNTAIAGGGATPITGVDGRITSHVAALNDGSGNLLPAYDFNSDGVHESNEARFIIAQAWRDQLEADGLV